MNVGIYGFDVIGRSFRMSFERDCLGSRESETVECLEIVPHGLVRKTDTPLLVMVRERADGGITLSLADPDLRLPKRRNMGYLDDEANATPARPSQVRLELRGKWAMQPSVPDVSNVRCSEEITVLEFHCRHGKTIEVGLSATLVALEYRLGVLYPLHTNRYDPLRAK